MKKLIQYKVAVLLLIVSSGQSSFGLAAEVVEACKHVYSKAVADVKIGSSGRYVVEPCCSGFARFESLSGPPSGCERSRP